MQAGTGTRETLQSCVTKHIYICSLQVCTPGRGTRKSHAIQPASLPRERQFETSHDHSLERGRWAGEKSLSMLSGSSMSAEVGESERAGRARWPLETSTDRYGSLH